MPFTWLKTVWDMKTLPGIRQGLEPRRDVDTVSIEVLTLDHHVAEVDADPKDNPAILGDVAVGRIHGFLQLHRARDRVHGAGELHQHAVSHHFDDPAVMSGDQRLEDVRTPGLKGSQRTGLVRLHQAAVADHIGGQNGGKTALGAFFGHPRRLLSKGAVQQLLPGHLNSLWGRSPVHHAANRG